MHTVRWTAVSPFLSFPDPTDPGLLYVEYPTGALHIEDESEVQAAKLKFERLCTEALSPTKTVALIERIISEQLSR